MALAFPPTRYTLKTAGPFWMFILNRFGFLGITVPGRRIYIKAGYETEQWLINHELAHIAQLDRDGPLKFWTMIVLDYIFVGYERSPYEIEARTYERHPR